MNRIAQFIVTTALITLLAYPGTAPSLNVAGTVRVNTLTVAGGGGGGGGCTVNSGNVFNECFENTGSPGYDLTWTEVAGAPDENSALPASFARLGSEAYKVVLAGSDTEYSRHDNGSAVTSGTRYFRFYVYWSDDNFPNGGGETIQLLSAWETTDTSDVDQRAFTTWLSRDFGVFLKCQGDIPAASIEIAADAWYRVEIKWVRGSAGEMKVYDSSDVQVGTTQAFNAGPLADWRYTVIGTYSTMDTGDTSTYYIDGLGVSDSGYLGQ